MDSLLYDLILGIPRQLSPKRKPKLSRGHFSLLPLPIPRRTRPRTTLWNKGVVKNGTNPKPKVHVPEQITVPPDILRTLSLGPKFAVEPKTSAPELLAMVRQVSRHVPEQEQPHSISEGVDAVSRYRPAGSKVPVKRVQAFLKEHSLVVLPADKEGGFAILTLGLFGSKAHAALIKIREAGLDTMDALELCTT
ncbi:hypothetical protein MTO96_041213 [Rhipicephalus appendiculatus]